MALPFDDYTVTTGKPFEEAVAAVRALAEANGFSVLAETSLASLVNAAPHVVFTSNSYRPKLKPGQENRLAEGVRNV